jgi:RNA polymerase I-specific transcription initiation factor RRN3
MSSQHELLYCYSIMERNKGVKLPKPDPRAARSDAANGEASDDGDAMGDEGSAESANRNGGGRAAQQEEDDEDEDEEDLLDSFFPFDPYRLSGSRSYIDGIFLEWQSGEGEEDSDDEDEDEDAEREQDQMNVESGTPSEEEGETLMLRKTLAAVGVMKVDEDEARGPRR